MKRAALALALLAVAAVASAKEAVPFIENDYAAALKQAKLKKQPIFVDAWAPW